MARGSAPILDEQRWAHPSTVQRWDGERWELIAVDFDGSTYVADTSPEPFLYVEVVQGKDLPLTQQPAAPN